MEPSTSSVQQQANIIVIGDSNIGKSAIISQFVDDVMCHRKNSTDAPVSDQESTLLDIEGKKLKVTLVEGGMDEVRAEQTMEIMGHVMGCIFLFDTTKRESFEKVKQYLDKVNDYPNIKSKLLAGIVRDGGDRQVTAEEAQATAEAQNMTYAESNPEKCYSVNDAITNMVHEIAKSTEDKSNKEGSKIWLKQNSKQLFNMAMSKLSNMGSLQTLKYISSEDQGELGIDEEFEGLPQLGHSMSRHEEVKEQAKFTTSCAAPVDAEDLGIVDYDFQRINISKVDQEDILLRSGKDTTLINNCNRVQELLEMRDKYIFHDDEIHKHPLAIEVDGESRTEVIPALAGNDVSARMREGVFQLFSQGEKINTNIVTVYDYYNDLKVVLGVTNNAPAKTFAYKRVNLLEQKYGIHQMYNKEREMIEQKINSFKDFYTVNKVDTHIHHSACMSQKLLLQFIREKLTTEANEIVHQDREGKQFTLQQVFEDAGIKLDHISSASLDVQADSGTFQRFDVFNTKYNLMGIPLLREIFLKTENFIKGRYIAEITKKVLAQMEATHFTRAEWRISIYGRSQAEWKKLANWFSLWEIKSDAVAWMIQVPRLYALYKKLGTIESFQDMLTNIFEPVMAATLNPEEHPEVAHFLTMVTGFDSVDDESVTDTVRQFSTFQTTYPECWNGEESPPYSYWCYYMWANITLINKVRQARGLNTFTFRPHCGEAGSYDHLAAAYLTSHGIAHGINLHHSPVLQYLYYLKQIGIAISPLSNNKLFLAFRKNPCPRFFKRGMNLSLSTDDPLIIHMTDEPLLEEFSVCSQVWGFSRVDLSELVRNSVIQSSFPLHKKKKWLGDQFLEGKNDMTRTDFSSIRHQFRLEVFKKEREFIKSNTVQNS